MNHKKNRKRHESPSGAKGPKKGTAGVPFDIGSELQRAVWCHQSGQLQEAEAIYKKILAVNPSHADSLHLLGVISLQVGNYGRAARLIQKAIQSDPCCPFYFNNLGAACKAQGKLDEAVSCYQEAVQLNPRYAEAYYNMSSVFHDRGDFEEAVSCCRKALEIQPHYFQAYYNMGNALQAQGAFDEAISCYREAVRLEPALFQAYNNMGNAHRVQGRSDDAAACYRKTIQINPDMFEGHNNLGTMLREEGRLGEALSCCRRAVELKPDYVDALCSMGIIYSAKKDPAGAISCYRKVLKIMPENAEAYNLMGIAYREKGDFDKAISCYRKALELSPLYAEAAYNMGIARKETGDFGGAISCYRQAVEMKPDYAEAYNNMGIVHQGQGELAEAVFCYQKALQINPSLPEAYNSMGNAYQDQGRADEAVSCYRKALQVRPDYASAHSNLLFSLLHTASADPARIFSEHKGWAERHASAPAQMIVPPDNDRSPDRRIRIGYVSPDFRLHSVAYFIEALLVTHDRSSFEIFCYSDVAAGDTTTDRLRGAADCWRDIFSMSDEQVAQQVRRDGIDILVDLAGHTNRNRLLVFAQKPAPVQVTYIGYPHTTGLATVDYRVTDSFADPDGQADRLYTEKLVRLPGCFLCYRPPEDAPAVATPPVLETGCITFGSFNKRSKMTPETIALWSRILDAVPGSRLVLKSRSFQDTMPRELVSDLFATQGISAGRIRFHGYSASSYEHLELYNSIDIGLDTFPYNGTTTTCEALWMGVPVIVLAGDSHASRVGVSLLSNTGMPELIAGSAGDYVEKAVQLARDTDRLKTLRARLRCMMADSPLMDAQGSARSLEAAYRQMWRRWCDEDLSDSEALPAAWRDGRYPPEGWVHP